jgi:outer membrane lipoprotein SlyB
MNGRSVGAIAMAACMIVAMTGTAVAQSNTMQKIRYGEVVSVEETVVEVKARGSGAQLGATLGAVAGYALGGGRDRWRGGLLGGVLGGAAGKASDRRARKKKGWQLIIRMEETGEEIGVQVPGKKKEHSAGDRVRLLTGPGGETQVKNV